MIDIRNISFRYGRNKPNVLSDLSLTLPQGRIIGLLGQNGTGKSTLISLIAGLLTPQDGEILIDEMHANLREPQTLSSIFVIPDEIDLPNIQLDRFVQLYAPFYPYFSQTDLETNLQEFELTPDVHLGNLSLGQRKKAFISFALACHTHYLLMDEPTNGLDIPAKAQFRRVIATQMDDNRTILISTHQVHDVETLIDHVITISDTHLQLNTSTTSITSQLCFQTVPVGTALHDALYTEPTPAGTAVVRRNTENIESPLNLELLFNALSYKPETITSLFTINNPENG